MGNEFTKVIENIPSRKETSINKMIKAMSDTAIINTGTFEITVNSEIFKYHSPVGAGTYGSAFKYTKGDNIVIIKMTNEESDTNLASFITEYMALKKITEIPDLEIRLEYPKIIKFYLEKESRTRYAIVINYIEGKSFLKYITDNITKAPISNVLSICKTLANKINLLHSNGMVHRDLSYQNVMIKQGDLGCDAVIIDYGSTCNTEIIDVLGDNYSRCLQGGVTTTSTIAPEMLALHEYEFELKRVPEKYRTFQRKLESDPNYSIDAFMKADIYSMGIIMLQLIVDRVPTFEEDSLNKIKYNFNQEFDNYPKLKEIILKCISVNSEDRPDSQEVVNILNNL